MPRLPSLILALAVAAPLGAQDAPSAPAAASAAPAAAPDASVQQGQAQLERVRGRIEAVQTKLDADRTRHDRLQEEVQKSEQQIAQIRAQVGNADKQIAEALARAHETQEQLGRLNKILDTQRASLGHQLRSAFLVGERGQVKLLLNQEDAQKMGRMLTYYDYLNRARTKRMQIIQGQLDGLRQLQEKLRAQFDEATALKDQQQRVLATFESARGARQAALAKLAERIADEVEELKSLKANEKETRALLESLQEVLADIPMEMGNAPSFTEQRGRLPWPLRGLLLADFGSSKVGGKLTWNGIWIGTDTGTPVQAVARGRVAYVGWLHRYGLIVILEHDAGYFSLYGHADAANVTVGQWVNAGDIVATAGNTGGYDRPGLYFEIRKGSDAVNPNEWLAAK